MMVVLDCDFVGPGQRALSFAAANMAKGGGNSRRDFEKFKRSVLACDGH
jgi:hypothetical protein